MSKTLVDMAKVTQMLDTGWQVAIFRGAMGSYEVRAVHQSTAMLNRALARIAEQMKKTPGAMPHDDSYHIDEGFSGGPALMTDDFSPEQALTRMAYKVFGEII